MAPWSLRTTGLWAASKADALRRGIGKSKLTWGESPGNIQQNWIKHDQTSRTIREDPNWGSDLEREREREREREIACVCVWVCVCVRETSLDVLKTKSWEIDLKYPKIVYE